jgi:50S ribosomal subunit-associated GTPase HflX
MYVFNKIDALKGEPRLGKILARAYKNAVCLTAQQPDDIRKLREALFQHFSKNMLELSLQVAYDNAALMAAIYAHSRILSTEWTDENAHFKIRVSRTAARRYFAQLLSPEERATLGLTPDEEDEHHPSAMENHRP